MEKILIAEDEKELLDAEEAVMTHLGFGVDTAKDGGEAYQKLRGNSYDVAVLDIMMPVMDGLDVVKKIRAEGIPTPVLMLTAKTTTEDKVAGLDMGADDYLSKPFEFAELAARVKALARRGKSYTPAVLSVGDLTLDTSENELSAKNSIRLAEKETKLLEYLILNQGRAVDDDELFQRVWGDEEESRDATWLYVSFLNGKLDSINSCVKIAGKEGGPYRLEKQA